MKHLLLGLLSFITPLFVVAAPRSWTFGDGTMLRLNLPEGMTCEQISPPSDKANQAFTLRYPDANAVSTITYQFIVSKADPSTDWSTVEKIDEFLMRAGKKGLQGSVEKELKPIHLRMKHGAGSYLIFTDAALANKPISRPGVFRYMAMVACKVGDYTIFVRGYTNSKSELYFIRMNQVIEGIELVRR